jgi:hypothetical protein
MRTTVTLPDPLFQNAKCFAEERRTTLSTLIEDALRRRMAEKPAQPAKKFKLFTVGGRLVNPDLNLDCTSALIAADDEEFFGRANARR